MVGTSEGAKEKDPTLEHSSLRHGVKPKKKKKIEKKREERNSITERTGCYLIKRGGDRGAGGQK